MPPKKLISLFAPLLPSFRTSLKATRATAHKHPRLSHSSEQSPLVSPPAPAQRHATPQMQILRLLAARRAAAAATSAGRRKAGEDDEGPFFDLDFSSCSIRASSYSSGSLSGSDSDDDELDFTIFLQRSHSASPLKFCASEPPTRANSLPSQRHGDRRRGIGSLRTLSFGARKAAPLYGRHSFARSSTSSARSLRLFVDSPPRVAPEENEHAAERTSRRAPSQDVIRRCLAKFSRRIRTAVSPRATAVVEARGLRRLRKYRSASFPPTARRDDNSAVEKQDGIASAIAHCKESLHRVEHAASLSDRDSPLVRSRSDPGKWKAA